MKESSRLPLSKDRDELLAKIDSLEKQIYRKQLELDILNKAVELVKKNRASIHGDWRITKRPP